MDLLGFGRSLSAGVLHLARFIEHRVCIRVKIAGESDGRGLRTWVRDEEVRRGTWVCDEEERRGRGGVRWGRARFHAHFFYAALIFLLEAIDFGSPSEPSFSLHHKLSKVAFRGETFF